jgi:hypothetical protein
MVFDGRLEDVFHAPTLAPIPNVLIHRPISLVAVLAALSGLSACGHEQPTPSACDTDYGSIECLCEKCGNEGGTCGDGCIDADGPIDKVCYHPRRPAADQFLCDGLLDCSVGEVCLYVRPDGDGCYVHKCVAPPPACSTDVTCACIKGQTMLGADCSMATGGVEVTYRNEKPWRP